MPRFGVLLIMVALTGNGIHTLVMCGVVTSGVVLSTLCHASDSDYRVLVPGDCCSDIDQNAHALLVEKVFPRHATILTSIELIHILKS